MMIIMIDGDGVGFIFSSHFLDKERKEMKIIIELMYMFSTLTRPTEKALTEVCLVIWVDEEGEDSEVGTRADTGVRAEA